MSPSYVRNIFLSADLGRYIAAHTTPPDTALEDLRAETQSNLPGNFQMQIGDDQAIFIELLVRAIGARNAVEIGTFTGYSSIAIARGLGPDGHLLCCDVSDEWTSIARKYWDRTEVSDRIELRLAPAIETLRQLPQNVPIDFVFIDAVKTEYIDYYELVLPLVRQGGIILIDNTLQGGQVLESDNDRPNVTAIRALNDHVVNDRRVKSVLTPIGDGLTFVQKR